ncbi:MAG: hypothetical protein M1833_004495 [Piccolia ochrophora]|nr:MAG: hypothetical protein M1833_004495 [Piccolia ochrophora]
MFSNHSSQSLPSQYPAIETARTGTPVTNGSTAHVRPPTNGVMHKRHGQMNPTPQDFDFRLAEAASSATRTIYGQANGFDENHQIHRLRSRSGASQKVENGIHDDDEDAPPIPDLHQRTIHIPLRTSSRHSPKIHDLSPTTMKSAPRSTGRDSFPASIETYDTMTTSTLPPLQTTGPPDDSDTMEPLLDDDPKSYDLVAPPDANSKAFSLETRAGQLFSREHLEIIFADPALLLKFTAFLSSYRPRSVPILIYYLDAMKAIKAISYANAVAEALEPIDDLDFTTHPARSTVNSVLEDKAEKAFEALVREELPAYITHSYVQVVSLSITRRITGTLPMDLREASEGLAEVFCLTDPSRPDNPIVFASEEFHRTTQYGMSYAIGRNCRFLQGPRTNPFSITRIRDALEAGREHCEVFLNYRGRLRYFIGAQVDVSGIVKECSDMESFRRLVTKDNVYDDVDGEASQEKDSRKDELQELSEMLNMQELETVRRWGGRMHREPQEDELDGSSTNWHKPRLLLAEPSPDLNKNYQLSGRVSGKLIGVYEHYLLVRPYPSMRVLFASPSLRVPGILQSPFMDKIGGSSRVRDELTQALAEGRGVTAKVRWLSKVDEDGRNRWIHCTPLVGSNGQIGVWMVVIVDEEKEKVNRRWRQAPPVDSRVGNGYPTAEERRRYHFPLDATPKDDAAPGFRSYNHGASDPLPDSPSRSISSSTNTVRLG